MNPTPPIGPVSGRIPFPALVHFALLTVVLASVAPARAQLAPTPPPAVSGKDDPIQLSPFVISEGSDIGYTSSTTLAGTRLRTEFKDVASQIAVMTPEFLADIGAVTNDDAFVYSSNIESGAEVAGTASEFFGGSGVGNSAPNRTRGLGGASNTRNFFGSDIPNDVYNTGDGGLTIASGPNAILFGLGSPAGLVDSRYNSPRLGRSQHRLFLSTDANQSRRVSADLNQPLIRDRLGARLALLDTDRHFPLRPAYEKDRRLTTALGAVPWRRLRVDVFAEFMDRRTSRPVYLLPKDSATPWVNPGMGNRTPYNDPDKSPTGNTNINVLPNTGYLNGWTSGQDLAPTYAYGANVAQPGVYSFRYTPSTRILGTLILNGYRVAEGFTSNPTLLDERLYPFRKYNVYGASHPSNATARHWLGQATLALAPDLNLEGALNYEHYFERTVTLYRPAFAQLNIDPSAYLYRAGYTPLDPLAAGSPQTANRAANAANRGPNPMLGTLYLDSNGIGSIAENTRKEARTSLAYVWDAAARHRGRWLAWLGRHQFSANLSYNEIENVSQSFTRLIKDDGRINPATGYKIAPSVITAANAIDGTSKTGRYLMAANRQFRTRSYVDPNQSAYRWDTLGGLDPFGTWTFRDDAGQPYEVGLFDLGGGTTAASGRRSAGLSRALAWQSYLWQNRVVLTFGQRWDTVRLKEVDAVVAAIDANTGLAPLWSTVPWQRYYHLPTFSNTSKSVVVHPWPWLSLFYNLSTNDAAEPASAHDIDGALYPAPSGDNRDYGLRLQLGGVGLRVNQFRTAQQNTNAGTTYGNTGFKQNTLDLEARFIALQRARANALGQPVPTDYYGKSATAPGFNAADYAYEYYRINMDSLATGTEVEVAGRVGRFDLRVAAGRTHSIRSNLGSRWIQYLEDPVMFQRMENLEWYAFDNTSRQYRPVVAISSAGQMVFGAPGATPLKGWQNINMADAGTGNTMYGLYTNTILPFALRQKEFDGMTNPAIREWRFNATAAWNFRPGWRGGLSTRLRAKANIGYATRPVTMEIAGRSVSAVATDVGAPLYNQSEWYFDPFLSWTTRFAREQRLTVRLNIRNVLNRHDLITTQVYSSTASQIDVNDPRFAYYGWKDPSALTTLVQAQDPREVTLAATLDF